MAFKASPADSFGVSLRRLWQRMQEGALHGPGTATQSRPPSDPQLQSGLSLHSLAMSAKLAFGVVIDAAPLAHCYRVHLEKGHAPVTATLGLVGSYHVTGVKPLATLQPGTTVLAAWHPGLPYAVIIACVPPPSLQAGKSLCQHLTQGSRARVDECHLEPHRSRDGGHITDWAAGRPFDSTACGEQGFIAETGTRIWMDPWMAQLGVDEACGVTAFYHDQLLRLAGYNLRMFTAGMVREALDDQEEYNDWSGYTPYPWEQLGLVERGDPARELSAEQWQLTDPWYANLEPAEDQLRPWHREVEHHGYLGQGGKRIVCAPPLDAVNGRTRFHEVQPIFPGLFDQTTLLDGRHSLASAKGISIVKRLGIVHPAQRHPPEQIRDEGDNPEDYRASGAVGEGPAHTVSSSLLAPGSLDSLTRAAGLLDLHAYLFNYASNQGFYWHAKDWALPEESELTHTEGVSLLAPDFAALETGCYLQAPAPKEIHIDHRYGQAKYWQNSCGIELLEDGGLLSYDGFGAEDRMTAGHRWLTTPGDLHLHAGRNVVLWAGQDIILRAKRAIDLTTTEGDIRSKAERNNHMLAGNSGQGGVLIESRGAGDFDFQGKAGQDVSHGGIALRASEGGIVGWGQNIYLRTGGGGISGGPIVLDADSQPLVTIAAQQQHYVQQAADFHFGEPGEARRTARLSSNQTLLPGQLYCLASGIFDGSVIANGSFLATSGHILTAQAGQNPFVAPLEDPGLGQAQSALAAAREQIDTEGPRQADDYYEQALQPLLYDEQKPGHEDTIRHSEFSLRTRAQYRAEDVAVPEDRWQQLARLSGYEGEPWVERPVACQLDPQTHPWPGKEAYREESQETAAYLRQDLSLFEFSGRSGAPAERGEQGNLHARYTEPSHAAPTRRSLNAYFVIRRN